MQIVNGAGQGTATVSFGLNDPGTRGNDGRITLTELTQGVLNPSTLAAAPTLGGSATLTLPIRGSVAGLTPAIPPGTNPRATRLGR